LLVGARGGVEPPQRLPFPELKADIVILEAEIVVLSNRKSKCRSFDSAAAATSLRMTEDFGAIYVDEILAGISRYSPATS
jgi:hypothetical protein